MFVPATENDYDYSESCVFSGVHTPNDRMTTANLGFEAHFVIAASSVQVWPAATICIFLWLSSVWQPNQNVIVDSSSESMLIQCVI